MYRLRHDCYFGDGLILPRPDSLFSDEYDRAENAITFGFAFDDQLVASIRVHRVVHGQSASPTIEAFGDLLRDPIERGATIIDGSRFVVATCDVTLRRRIVFSVMRLPIMAAEHCFADLGVAAVRPAHVAFYERYGGFRVTSEPRAYNGLTAKLVLLTVDYRKERHRIRAMSHYFHGTMEGLLTDDLFSDFARPAVV